MKTIITRTSHAAAKPTSLQRRILNAFDHYSSIVLSQWLVRFPRMKDTMTRIEYDMVSALDRDGEVLCMNYGYALMPPLTLPTDLENNRYQVQMYHHVASPVEWSGRKVLEIGSGRGGGADYLMRHFQPASLIGLDLSPRAVAFCQRRYAELSGLSFQTGSAEDLPFPAQSFEIVINVESSLHYPRIERFFAETARVLKPGGYFLYADLRYPHELDGWRAQIDASGLVMLSEENISTGVLRALEVDRERKRQLIERLVPRPLRFPFQVFAGLEGLPQLGHRVYLVFVLLKQ